MKPHDALTLLDWKRRIFRVYSDVRAARDPRAAWEEWRQVRDDMFRDHPQSPIPPDERPRFGSLEYFDYDERFRTTAQLREVEPKSYQIGTSGEGTMDFTRFATVTFSVGEREAELEVYWLDAYGGGIFLPFRDSTAGTTTYGAGRYLLDTVKGADLGSENEALVLDFNFAYNPSCSYDPRWVCPLAPPPNRLDFPIEAGERHV